MCSYSFCFNFSWNVSDLLFIRLPFRDLIYLKFIIHSIYDELSLFPSILFALQFISFSLKSNLFFHLFTLLFAEPFHFFLFQFFYSYPILSLIIILFVSSFAQVPHICSSMFCLYPLIFFHNFLSSTFFRIDTLGSPLHFFF